MNDKRVLFKIPKWTTCLDNIQIYIDKLNSEWKFIIKLVPIKINQQQQ
jgi:hypothetical protein